MNILKLKDFILHVCIPISVGCIIYFLSATIQFNSLIRNYLPDGLWAYAFFSCLFILWNRRINIAWTIAALLTFIIFEVLQYANLVNGTADVWDVIVYAGFSCLAMLTNQFYNYNSKIQTV